MTTRTFPTRSRKAIRNRIIAEARAWIGTPYMHQASLKGVGCDCLGLFRGVWHATHGTEPEPLPATHWAEANGEERLAAAARRHLIEIDSSEAAPGDVLLFCWRPHPPAKHATILSGDDRMIHAYDGAAVSLIRAVLEAARGVCVSLSVRHKLAGALRVATARCRWCSEISEQSDAGTGLGPAPGEPRVRPRRLPARPDRRKVPNASPSGSTTPLQWHRRFPAPCAGNPRRAFEILWLERSCQPQGLFHTNTKRPDTTSGSKRSWAGEARGRASSDADHAGTAAAQGERMREIAGRPPARNEIDKRLEEGSA